MEPDAINKKSLDVVLNRNLASLKTCNVVDAWSFVKHDIEEHIGKNLVCVPHLVDGLSYNITSVFIKTNQSGARGKRFRTYKPLGLVKDLIDKDKSHTSWHDVSSKVIRSEPVKDFQSYKLTLMDEPHQRKICVATTNFTRSYVPPQYSPIGKITFSKGSSEDIAAATTVYLVNNVIKAGTVDLYIDVGDYSRVFHYGDPHPLVNPQLYALPVPSGLALIYMMPPLTPSWLNESTFFLRICRLCQV
ncbi:Uncharacterized protein GBIM_00807 [Gryllus bimaculatus]|nr:Uncharacterized protein GBIM_00807 [Gryllus bimaculatus]